MFDFENMQSKFQEERRNLNAVRERLRAVNEIDLAPLMSDACALMEDEALQLLARDLPGGKRILIIKMRAQHITFSKAIKAITVRF